jgi:hypothetical protein
MNRDQIDNAAQAQRAVSADLDALLGTPTVPARGKQLIDINGEVSPAVLAGLLGCNVSMVYQYRQDGKLPPNSDATLRDCLKHHVLFWKNKSISKATGLSEAALIQKVQLDRARTESTWLQIKKERGELVETSVLAQVFEPHFLQMRTQLCSIARKFPDVQVEIDKLLNGWSRLGEELKLTAAEELDNFIQTQMEQEVEIDDTELPADAENEDD